MWLIILNVPAIHFIFMWVIKYAFALKSIYIIPF